MAHGNGWHRNIPLGTTTADTPLYNMQGYIARVSFIETTGSASATFNLYDGSNTSGVLIGTFNLAAGASVNIRYNPWDFPFDGGLYLDIVSGSIRGCVTVVTPDNPSRVGMPVILVNPEVLSVSVTPAL